MNFANIRNNEIIDMNSKYLDTDITRVEVSDEIYQAYLEDRNKVIYIDGEIVLNPNYEAEQELKERERIAKLKLTKREVFLAIYNDLKITPEEIKSTITDPAVLIEFEYANEYYRGNPLIDMIGASLGYTKEQLDYLFENKEFPPKKEVENVGMVS